MKKQLNNGLNKKSRSCLIDTVSNSVGFTLFKKKSAQLPRTLSVFTFQFLCCDKKEWSQWTPARPSQASVTPTHQLCAAVTETCQTPPLLPTFSLKCWIFCSFASHYFFLNGARAGLHWTILIFTLLLQNLTHWWIFSAQGEISGH